MQSLARLPRVALVLLGAAPLAFAQNAPPAAAAGAWTAAQDHADMMRQLGITQLRPGPSGREVHLSSVRTQTKLRFVIARTARPPQPPSGDPSAEKESGIARRTAGNIVVAIVVGLSGSLRTQSLVLDMTK
ncbi:MAG: hypothetical protein Q8N18_08845 [Opitutaceae bacterium]|nr:hypothetical protein [Opitutaceae bacterium]